MSRTSTISEYRCGFFLIAPDHRVETPSVVKPTKEVKKTSNVVVEAENPKVTANNKLWEEQLAKEEIIVDLP